VRKVSSIKDLSNDDLLAIVASAGCEQTVACDNAPELVH
jgi:hypothetical protein